ncbi:probable Histone acetyltransferase SAS2 [Zygosaccharomyces bailii ISA1307]|nr:probable Histone acetyltransferase SAS2 [Zygosaccharomyces bailii ISA1307]
MTEEGDGLYGILNERNIKEVQFGIDKRFPTWYGSNVYFDSENKTLGYIEHEGTKNRDKTFQYWLNTLYVCEYCFKYTNKEESLAGHAPHCEFKKRPPGRIKYKSPDFTIRRVKGAKHRLFCQCLCLFTKLFLDNKSMYFKVDHYDFYIVYENNSTKPMGFFSKDLVSYFRNNLACVLVFPPYQRRQLGTLLLDFSYAISKFEGLISGPETPLSPFGLIGYLKYWSMKICWHLTEGELAKLERVTLENISAVTGFRIGDIITTLKYLGCLGGTNEIYLSVLKKKLNRNGLKSLINDEYLLLDD